MLVGQAKFDEGAVTGDALDHLRGGVPITGVQSRSRPTHIPGNRPAGSE
jgi:hypothetical protein